MCGEGLGLVVYCGLSLYSKHLCEMNELLRNRRVEMYNRNFKMYTFKNHTLKLLWRKVILKKKTISLQKIEIKA